MVIDFKCANSFELTLRHRTTKKKIMAILSAPFKSHRMYNMHLPVIIYSYAKIDQQGKIICCRTGIFPRFVTFSPETMIVEKACQMRYIRITSRAFYNGKNVLYKFNFLEVRNCGRNFGSYP